MQKVDANLVGLQHPKGVLAADLKQALFNRGVFRFAAGRQRFQFLAESFFTVRGDVILDPWRQGSGRARNENPLRRVVQLTSERFAHERSKSSDNAFNHLALHQVFFSKHPILQS